MVNRSWQLRLLVRPRQPARGLISALLSTPSSGTGPLAAHLGWDCVADEDRPHGAVSLAARVGGILSRERHHVPLGAQLVCRVRDCRPGVPELVRPTGRRHCAAASVGPGPQRMGSVRRRLHAVVPIVWAPVLDEYHPQDMVAVGLVLASIACVKRREWVWAGMLLGLAVTTQQFALLALAPLVVVVPGKARWRLLGAAAVAAVVISLPMVIVTSGRAIHGVLLGTGDSMTLGGTVLWELSRGPVLVFSAGSCRSFSPLQSRGGRSGVWARGRSNRSH